MTDIQEDDPLKPGPGDSPSKSDIESDEERTRTGEASVPTDDNTFKPTRNLFIQHFGHFGTTIDIADLTSTLTTPYDGGEIPNALYNAAKDLATKNEASKPRRYTN